MRENYEMSEKQLEALLDASSPVICMKIGNSLPTSPQENANAAWATLGRKLGFDHMSVKPISGKSTRFFSAESKPSDSVST